MTFSCTATAESTHSPPRVRIDVTESEPTNTITSLVLYRDGVKLRFEPVITGAGSALVYDYDAPFDVAMAYRAEGTEAGVTLDWTEAWPDLADWLSPYGIAATGWAVAAGVATSTDADAIIYRDTTDNIARVEVVNPSNVTVALASDTDFQHELVSVRTGPDGFVTITAAGGSTFTDESGDVRFTSGGGTVVAGTGGYVINLTDTSVSVVGDTWSATVPLRYVGDGITQVRIIAPPFATPMGEVGESRQYGGIAVDSTGAVWVVDVAGGVVRKFDSDGVPVLEFGTPGTGDGEFDPTLGPGRIAVDSTDRIIVTDPGNNRVQVFDDSGVFDFEFGTAGTGNGQFDVPGGVAVDSSDNIWVTDRENERVQEFNSAGVYQSQFGSVGTGNTQFIDPVDIAIDAADNVWVADYYTFSPTLSKVKKYSSAGVYSLTVALDGLPGVSYDPTTDTIWIPTYGTNELYQYDTAGVLLETMGASVGDSPSDLFAFPADTAFDGSILYATDALRIQKFYIGPGSIEDVTAHIVDDSFNVVASDTETLTPTGDAAGVWLVNAAQPELSILAEHEPLSSDAEYFIVPTTRVGSELKANSVALAIEGSADIVTVAVGPRRRETWSLDIACTTESARQTLIALLGDSAAVNLRMPSSARWSGLVPGFYAVGDVSSERRGHPQLGPIVILSLPLTPSRAPAYLSLWQWNMRALAQTGMTMADVSNAYPTMLDLLVGPA